MSLITYDKNTLDFFKELSVINETIIIQKQDNKILVENVAPGGDSVLYRFTAPIDRDWEKI